MLAVWQVDPPRIRDEGDVLLDVKDEVSGRAVVAADAAGYPFAGRYRVLALVVDFVPDIAGIGDVAGQARHRGRAQECHVLGPPGNGEKIGAEHQVVEKRLQPTVEQGREGDVALLLAALPQPFVHFDIEQQIIGRDIAPQPPHVAEAGAVLEGFAKDRLEAFVELVVRRIGQGLIARGVDIPQMFRHGRRRRGARGRGSAARSSRRRRKAGSRW